MKTDLKDISAPSKTRKSGSSEKQSKAEVWQSLSFFAFIPGFSKLATLLLEGY